MSDEFKDSIGQLWYVADAMVIPALFVGVGLSLWLLVANANAFTW